MESLFYSGNFAGLVGLSLMVVVGFRLIRNGQFGGWFLSLGASCFAFSIIYRLYLEPLLQKPIHLTFNHTMITLVTIAPTMTLTVGFILLTLGLLMVAARQQKEREATSLRRS